jgi:hypothetical protein
MRLMKPRRAVPRQASFRRYFLRPPATPSDISSRHWNHP